MNNSIINADMVYRKLEKTAKFRKKDNRTNINTIKYAISLKINVFFLNNSNPL